MAGFDAQIMQYVQLKVHHLLQSHRLTREIVPFTALFAKSHFILGTSA